MNRVDRAADALRRAFPDLGDRAARFAAGALADAVDEADGRFHYGKEDRQGLAALDTALDQVDAALDRVSPWVREALSTALHARLLGQGGEIDRWKDRVPRLPAMTCDDLRAVVAEWRAATGAAGEMMGFGKPEGQSKWRTLALVDEARRAWEGLGGRPLPRGEIEGHAFEALLGDLFDAFGLDASPRGQYRALAKLEKQSGWGDWRP